MDSVKREHVISILGPKKAKDKDAVDARIAQIERMKKDLRTWARKHIHKRVVGTARLMKLKFPKGKKQVSVSTYKDLQQWWRTRERSDILALKALGFLMYGWFDRTKKWDIALEKKFMTEQKWEYTTQSVEAAQENSERDNFELKGCVALTISYIKNEMVKQMQRVGKAAKHGLVLKKSRPRDMAYNAAGKYVKLKRGQYYTMLYESDDDSTQDGDKKPKAKKVTLMSEEGFTVYRLIVVSVFVFAILRLSLTIFSVIAIAVDCRQNNPRGNKGK